MFQTSVPVTAEGFLDRNTELAILGQLVERLRAGHPSWLCILGARKVGKTSLILELCRRHPDPAIVFSILDTFETVPLSPEIFRRYALRIIDATFARELGQSPEALRADPFEYRAALHRSKRFGGLPPNIQSELNELLERPMTEAFIRSSLRVQRQP